MKISQAEARRLKRRVRKLESDQRRQRSYWSNEYPGGTNILRMAASAVDIATIRTAQRLSHTIVVKHVDGLLAFYALPQGEEQKP